MELLQKKKKALNAEADDNVQQNSGKASTGSASEKLILGKPT